MEFAITTLIALVALAVTVATFRGQNRGQFKRLHYVSHYFRLVIPFSENGDNEIIRVNFRATDEQLIAPHLVVLRLENTGAAAITPSDYSGPIELHFGNNAWFCGGSIGWNRPGLFPGRDHPIKYHYGGLHIAPLLLNPGDQLTIIGLVDGYPEGTRVVARIAGVQEVATLPPPIPGMQGTVTATSLVYRFTREWPKPRFIAVWILSIPVFLDPDDTIHQTVMAVADGVRINSNPYLCSVMFFPPHELIAQLPTAGDVPIGLEFHSSHVVHCQIRVGTDPVHMERGQVSRIVTVRSSKVEIHPRILRLFDREKRVEINFFLEGEPDRVSVTSQPDWLDDITQMKVSYEDYAERHLAATQPRILLSNAKMYRLWHGLARQLSPVWHRIKSKTQREFRRACNRLRRVS